MARIHPDQLNLGDISVRSLWNCPAGINPGDPVYQTAADAVDLADCRYGNQMPAEGIVESKPTTTTCYVVSHGSVHVSGWGLTPDREYFVGPGTGVELSSGIPSTPGTNVQPIGRSKNSEELLVDARSTIQIL